MEATSMYQQNHPFRSFYDSVKWKKVRAYIKKRDHGICTKCGGIGVEVHHIIPLAETNVYTELAIDPNNLTLLCVECHNAERSVNGLVRHDVYFDAEGNLCKKP